MRDLCTRIEQNYHPRPVLNTELNIDHIDKAAFRIGQKTSNNAKNALN
jgi:hypothetical protein